MTPILVALSAAVVYGTADFLGGLLSRRSHFAPVNVLGNLTALLVAGAALALTWPGTPPPAAAIWAVMAGICSGVGGLALYRGMSAGEMAVVGPVSAVGSAALPAIVGFATGERFSTLTGFGLALALPAIWLLAGGTNRLDRDILGKGVLDGLVAGAGFGGMFVGIHLAAAAPGLWPVTLTQLGTLIPGVASLMIFRSGWQGRVSPSRLRFAPLPGLLAASAVLLYQVSLRGGSMTLSSVITSLYPGFTVLLATWFLKERITALQQVGLGLAALAITLTVVG